MLNGGDNAMGADFVAVFPHKLNFKDTDHLVSQLNQIVEFNKFYESEISEETWRVSTRDENDNRISVLTFSSW